MTGYNTLSKRLIAFVGAVESRTQALLVVSTCRQSITSYYEARSVLQPSILKAPLNLSDENGLC